MGDLIFRDLQAGLTQYQHRDLVANYGRIRAELYQGSHVCALLHITPERKKYKDNIRITNSFAGNAALVKMLLAKRVDMILEFPWLINYELSQLNSPPELIKITITDAPAYEPAYIACPKIPWGMRIVTLINQVIPDIRTQISHYQKAWMTEEEIPGFREALAGFLAKLEETY